MLGRFSTMWRKALSVTHFTPTRIDNAVSCIMRFMQGWLIAAQPRSMPSVDAYPQAPTGGYNSLLQRTGCRTAVRARCFAVGLKPGMAVGRLAIAHLYQC